ncbi:MFS transporter [Chryseolinea sp. T2]|uniref:MFS transporter n=1 Tax=Chryseolinea sp. T2 TaxID=3129255 RepID=UPI003077753A
MAEQTTGKSSTSGSVFLIVVTYLAFVSLGLPDGLLGIAWPFMSARSNVPLEALGTLLISFTSGYLVTSSTSGKIMQLISLGALLTVSCLITALSLLTYAFTDYWYLMIIAAFFLGSGGGAIDSSINSFAASRFSASTVNWLHAFYGVGATAGPLLVTFMLANDMQWYQGYIAVATIQIGLAVLFGATQRRWGTVSAHEEAHSRSEYFETLKLSRVWIFMFIFFLYTGVEQGFGQWLFTVLTQSRALDEQQAGLWTSLYWGSLTIGRIVFGIVLTAIPVNKVLNGAIMGILAGIILFTLNISTATSLLGVVTLGFANAPVFPSLISVTPAQIGKEHTATAIGVQISMAMLGAALLPGLAGILSDNFGLEVIAKVFSIAALSLAGLYFISIRRR